MLQPAPRDDAEPGGLGGSSPRDSTGRQPAGIGSHPRVNDDGDTQTSAGLRGSPMAGVAAPDKTADPPRTGRAALRRARRNRAFWRELPVLFVIALVIALLIKSFVVQAFYIPSSSMENTLDIGDKVLVNKLVYHFRPIEPVRRGRSSRARGYPFRIRRQAGSAA